MCNLFTDSPNFSLTRKHFLPLLAACDNYALLKACSGGHTDIVRMLLSDPRVDPSCRLNKPIIRACEEGHLEIVRLLIMDHRLFPTNFSTCLQRASRFGRFEVVKMLLNDSRIPVNEALKATWSGKTALHWSATEGHYDICVHLINGGSEDTQFFAHH